MTRLDKMLERCKWVAYHEHFCTVEQGLGFALFRKDNQMWLAGYSKETIERRQRLHSTKGMEFTIYQNPPAGAMFNVPACPDLVSSVVLSVFPELT